MIGKFDITYRISVFIKFPSFWVLPFTSFFFTKLSMGCICIWNGITVFISRKVSIRVVYISGFFLFFILLCLDDGLCFVGLGGLFEVIVYGFADFVCCPSSYSDGCGSSCGFYYSSKGACE